jgi:hypothetical protein
VQLQAALAIGALLREGRLAPRAIVDPALKASSAQVLPRCSFAPLTWPLAAARLSSSPGRHRDRVAGPLVPAEAPAPTRGRSADHRSKRPHAWL